MRKLLIAVFLASAGAIPVNAQSNQHSGRAGHQQTHQSSGRQSSSPGRAQQGGHQPGGSHTPQGGPGPATVHRQPGYVQQQGGHRPGGSHTPQGGPGPATVHGQSGYVQQHGGHRPTIPHSQQGGSGQPTGHVQPGYVPQHGGTGRIQHQTSPQHVRSRTPAVGNVPHFGNEPPIRTGSRHSPAPHWNQSWRNDRRYDWHSYRQHHGSRYHVGNYHDPFGWGYAPFYAGWRLWPAYYAQSYWIADPWEYRLPPAPPGTRWIRYYNDAILVDEWSGEVLDVIQGFFW